MKYFAYIVIVMSCFCTAAFAEDINTEQLRQNAERGDIESQINLAMAYHDGAGGLKSSDEEAAKWFRKAAEQGDVEGEYNLAIAYYHGFGVKKDINEAVVWFKKAADQGYADAEYIIASAYQNGIGGLPKDMVECDLFLGLAEAHGNKDALRERIAVESTMSGDQVAQAKLLIAAQTSHANQSKETN